MVVYRLDGDREKNIMTLFAFLLDLMMALSVDTIFDSFDFFKKVRRSLLLVYENIVPM